MSYVRATLVTAGLLISLPATAQLDPRVATRVTALTRATVWTQVAAIKLPFRTFHPQGMVRIGDHFYLSAVEVRAAPKKIPAPIDGQAYDAGAGVGHLFKFTTDGRLIADIILGDGSVYHPGGIDYDGTSIWVPIAEYRPNSRSIVYRVDPDTMKAIRVLTVADHISAIVHDIDGKTLVGLSWGSRHRYSWPLGTDGKPGQAPPPMVNSSGYIDYQDCHYAGGRRMLCAGIAGYRTSADAPAFPLGGIDLIDLIVGRPIWQAPIALWSPSGRAMTQNPFWMEPTASGLRAWFVPDDDASTLFAFDAATPGTASDRSPASIAGGIMWP